MAILPDGQWGALKIGFPDVDSPEFKAEAHRQSAAVAEGLTAAEDQQFVDSISEVQFNEPAWEQLHYDDLDKDSKPVPALRRSPTER